MQELPVYGAAQIGGLPRWGTMLPPGPAAL